MEQDKRRTINSERSGLIPDFETALTELEHVYQELAKELEEMGPRCELSGRCCNFVNGQYILYASELEFEQVRRAVRSPGPWPLKPGGECPFQVEKKCSIHSARPLGCRTFFCDQDYRPREGEVYQKFSRRIAEISERCGIEWDYRPLHGDSAREALTKPKYDTLPAPVFPILNPQES